MLIGDQLTQKKERILLPVSQRREVQLQHIQPVKQILAKPAVSHFLFQVFVGGRDNAHINRNDGITSETHNLALLQNTQQTALEVWRHISDFI